MAIYHMNMGYISRKAGRSATAHAAYIGCTALEEARTGLVFDYSRKRGLLHQAILAPEECPEWIYNSQKLWTAVESFEDHIAQTRFRGHQNLEKNNKSLKAKEAYLETCKTAFTAVFALPLEITSPQDQVDLSRRIVKACYVQKGLITEYAIHADKGNPHLHILSVTRPWVEGSFTKTRFVLEREQLVEIRHLAASIANDFAKEKGYNYVLDARSYADQGLNILPSRHLGPQAYHKHKENSRIDHENQVIHRQNLLTLFTHPEEIIKLVATQKVVFTEADIAREVFKRVGGDMIFYSLFKAHLEGIEVGSEMLKVSNDNVKLKAEMQATFSAFAEHLLEEDTVVGIGKSLREIPVFTTQEAIALEDHVQTCIEHLCELRGKAVSSSRKEAAIKDAEANNGFSFSGEQKQAIDHLLGSRGLEVLTGKAGTGKTTILKPVVEAYRKAGYIPLGTAFQGKVSELLGYDLGIPSYTLDQLRHHWGRYDALKESLPHLQGKALAVAKGELERLSAYQLTDRHVVIVDEGNMVGSNLWAGLLSRVQDSGAHLRIIQDSYQIKAIYGADVARLIEEKAGAFDLTEVHRQKEKWMQEASSHLNNHDLIEGMKPYEEQGGFTYKDSLFQARYALTEAYLNRYISHPHEQHIVLALQTQEVQELNAGIRHQLKESGFLGESFAFKDKELAIGDQVVFTQNDHTEWFVKTVEPSEQKDQGSPRVKGVKNGTLGKVEAFDEETANLDVRLLKDNRLIRINLKTYDHLEYGYAMTINKGEGLTFDRVYGLFDPLMSANKVLVWMTRHRDSFQAFISREHASDLNEIVHAVARSEYRPLVADFGFQPSPEAEIVRKYMTAAYEAGKLWGLLSRENPDSPSEHSEWSDFQAAQADRNQCAAEILEQWDNCRTFVHQVGLKKITLEIQAGLRERELNEAECEALQRVETYRAVSHQERSLWNTLSPSDKASKTSVLVKEHEELTQRRNQLAYDIMTFPELHRPFFKTTKEKSESENETHYVSYGGEVYEKSPASFQTAERHAATYIKAQRQAAFTKKLTATEYAVFQELLSFKAQVKECGRVAAALKNTSPLLKDEISTLKATLEEWSTERDGLAFKIVTFYEKYAPLLERAEIPQDQLLKYAVFGEVRQLALKYDLATTLETRLQLADQLYQMVGEGEKFEKPLYGILKGRGIEFARLRFERECLHEIREGGQVPFETVEGCMAAFVVLRGNAYQDPPQDWHLITPSALEKSTFFERGASFIPANVVKAALVKNMAAFADDIFTSLGTPNNRAASNQIERRYGKGAGISVNLSTGAWVDHRNRESAGGPLEMLTQLKGMSFKEAVEYGASWAGITPEKIALGGPNNISYKADEAKRLQKHAQEQRVKIDRARALWAKGKAIEGTLAAQYLREHRNIAGPLPQDLRYLPQHKDLASKRSYPCLMVAARPPGGELTAVQITFLDPRTAAKAKIDVVKRSFGVLKGAFVTLQGGTSVGDSNTRVFISEGVETALSLKEAGLKPAIHASLGISNMTRLSAPPGTHVVLCADHDEPGSPASQHLEKSARELQTQGFSVTVIKPETLGEDFNDVLKAKGPQGVREILAKHLPQEVFSPEASKCVQKEEASLPKHPHKAVPVSFNDIETLCQKHLYAYLKEEVRALTPHLKERVILQAEKAADYISQAYPLNGNQLSKEKLDLFCLRARYELNRIPEIRKDILKEWRDDPDFNKKKDGLIAHVIAERQAAIEGRLYYEAKSKGLMPSDNIPELAEKELNTHRDKTEALVGKLMEKYSLSKKAATQCAKDMFRHKETHERALSLDQVSVFVQVAKELEGRAYPHPTKTYKTHEIEFLRRREGDLLFRAYSQGKILGSIEKDQLQIKAQASLEAVVSSISMAQELSKMSQKEFSL